MHTAHYLGMNRGDNKRNNNDNDNNSGVYVMHVVVYTDDNWDFFTFASSSVLCLVFVFILSSGG